MDQNSSLNRVIPSYCTGICTLMYMFYIFEMLVWISLSFSSEWNRIFPNHPCSVIHTVATYTFIVTFHHLISNDILTLTVSFNFNASRSLKHQYGNALLKSHSALSWCMNAKGVLPLIYISLKKENEKCIAGNL